MDQRGHTLGRPVRLWGRRSPPCFRRTCPPIASHPPIAVSHDQRANETYYERYVDQQVARGLIRQDGGGPDTPFDIDDVLKSFEQLAFL